MAAGGELKAGYTTHLCSPKYTNNCSLHTFQAKMVTDSSLTPKEALLVHPRAMHCVLHSGLS